MNTTTKNKYRKDLMKEVNSYLKYYLTGQKYYEIEGIRYYELPMEDGYTYTANSLMQLKLFVAKQLNRRRWSKNVPKADWAFHNLLFPKTGKGVMGWRLPEAP